MLKVLLAILLPFAAASYYFANLADEPPAEIPSSVKPDDVLDTISYGQAVDLAEHLADGHWTVVAFTADWSTESTELVARVQSQVERLGRFRMRIIDIQAADSDVARQYGIQAVPLLRLYKGHELVHDGAEPVVHHLDRVEQQLRS